MLSRISLLKQQPTTAQTLLKLSGAHSSKVYIPALNLFIETAPVGSPCLLNWG